MPRTRLASPASFMTANRSLPANRLSKVEGKNAARESAPVTASLSLFVLTCRPEREENSVYSATQAVWPRARARNSAFEEFQLSVMQFHLFQVLVAGRRFVPWHHIKSCNDLPSVSGFCLGRPLNINICQ